MRTPGITAKLFLAVLGVTLTVVVLMTVAAQLAFRSDFGSYLRDRERERMDTLAEVLAEHYRDHGGWQALETPARWRDILREAAWRMRREHDHHDDHDRDDHSDRDRNGPFEGRAPPPHRGDGRPPPGPPPIGPTLLDASGDRVAGPPIRGDDVERKPVTVAGDTVGWLVFRPAAGISDRLTRRFQYEQLRAALISALGVVILAAVVSILLARGFLAPVRRLARSTRALAAGRFDTRVEEPRRDELGQLAADFNRLAETLQRNERLRNEFMADMSHELRTPMAVLRAELEAMEDGVRPLTRESLHRLQGSVASLSKLIDDLYELSLSDAGALDYRMEPLDLAAMITETVDRWRNRLEDGGLGLIVDIPEAAVEINADERRLQQLLDNLLENSLRYTERGGRVRVGLTVGDGGAVVSLEDSAPGVPEEALQRLFERLYRVEVSRSRESGGAGLGLAICRNIARAHGGEVEAYASPLGGLGIRVTLPLAG